ncbi:S41 family peptidase [Pararhodonellum marinum]|uniref:S41 family peptidase n=1 Tax=Pararhodonellum marinum TaxID=2755358 RepID=UPI001890672A|nr:S41 family peptidase [Pararhodonellum marinum]
MLKYAFVILLLIFGIKTCPCQSIYKSALVSDLEFLQEAVTQGHPNNYHSDQSFGISNTLDRARSYANDTLSYYKYRVFLAQALQELGCLHTTIQHVPKFEFERKTSFFPLNVVLLQDKLYLTQQNKQVLNWKTGAEIKSINGIPSSQLVRDLLGFGASDGGGKAFSHAYVNRVMSSLLALYLEYPEQFIITLKDGTEGAFKSIDQPVQQPVIPFPYAPNEATANAQLFLLEEAAILKISFFENSDAAFFRRVFHQLNKKQIRHLILDLRGNLGGKRKAASKLTQWLVAEPFSYSILQPNLDPKPYFNERAKRNLALAKLRYNIWNVFKGRKTDLGREFTYKYKPKNQRFQGKVFVITDGFTASSSTMVTSWLRQHSDAVFIGRQAGGGYNGNNGGSFPEITLPHSGIRIKFPVFRLILDPDAEQRTGIVPDHSLTISIENYLQQTDADLKFILENLTQQTE